MKKKAVFYIERKFFIKSDYAFDEEFTERVFYYATKEDKKNKIVTEHFDTYEAAEKYIQEAVVDTLHHYGHEWSIHKVWVADEE